MLAVGNSAAVPMGVQLTLQRVDFLSPGFTASCGTSGSHGSSIFNFLQRYRTVFHNGSTQLRPSTVTVPQQYARFPFNLEVLPLLLP